MQGCTMRVLCPWLADSDAHDVEAATSLCFANEQCFWSASCQCCVLALQILTHVKEKLQFAQKEKQTMQVELDSVEAALATHRDDLGRVKLSRDKALAATRKLKDSVSHVSSASLLADLEVSHISSLHLCLLLWLVKVIHAVGRLAIWCPC